MKKITPADKKLLKELNGQLKKLEAELVVAKKVEGIDDYLSVKIKKSTASFKRIPIADAPDKGLGTYQLEIHLKAKEQSIFVPLSIASGKKPTGFVYQIEGTGESAIVRTDIKVKGDGVKQITLGTLEYAEIPSKGTAIFRLTIEIKGKIGKSYRVVINRINYKLTLGDTRYQQYQKPLLSDNIKFA